MILGNAALQKVSVIALLFNLLQGVTGSILQRFLLVIGIQNLELPGG